MKEVYPIEIRQGFAEDDMCVMMLYEPISHRNVPVIIGRHEAEMLLIVLQGQRTERPLTHELLCSLMDAYDLSLTEVTIDRLEDGVYYVSLHVTDGFSNKTIDARSSDAIVMALCREAPVRIAESVLDESGFPADNLHLDDLEERESTLEELEAQLRRCEEEEDYEKAAELMEQIRRRRSE